MAKVTIIGTDATGVRHAVLTDTGPLGTPQRLQTSALTAPADATRADPGAFVGSFQVFIGAPAPPRRLVFIFGRNESGADRYIMLFDAAALPPNLTIPVLTPIRVATGKQFSLAVPSDLFTLGLVWAASITDNTLFASATADVWATTYTRL